MQIGPDNKLHVICGNFVEVGAVAPTSPTAISPTTWRCRALKTANNFGLGKEAARRFVIRMELNGKNPELYAAGQRNSYDIAFNADGELFSFDSDMEWDWGTPWYRPVRVFHIPSASDQGFREGTASGPSITPTRCRRR